MSQRIMMIKHGSALLPVDDSDRETMSALKAGKPYAVEVKSQSDRSLKHHRLFYGGLVRLAMDYYEPNSGLLTPAEKSGAKSFAKYLSTFGVDKETMNNAYAQWKKSITEQRRMIVCSPEMSTKSFVDWLKCEANHCVYEKTPGGIRKVPLSINFNSMSREEFNRFYRDCFSVVWRFVLSRKFESEEQAQQAIDQLVSMG